MVIAAAVPAGKMPVHEPETTVHVSCILIAAGVRVVLCAFKFLHMKRYRINSLLLSYLSLAAIAFVLSAFAIANRLSDPVLQQLLDSRPAIFSTVDSAYACFYPKGRKNRYDIYKQDILNKQKEWYELSGKKSRLLAMMAGIYESEGRKRDFSKLESKRDKEMDELWREVNGRCLDAIQIFNSGYLRWLTTAAPEGKPVKQYQQEMIDDLRINYDKMAMALRDCFQQMEQYWKKKGYVKVLAAQDSSYVYYVHILEMRGLMADKLTVLSDLAASVGRAAADKIEYCRKFPEECK